MIIREMILFSLLCLGALFFNSSEFVDTGIVPKWYMTITMGIVLFHVLCRHYMESYNIGECYNVLHLLG